MDNQKGMILISLLTVIIVLSILSIGVYSISYSASRQAQFTRDNAQAYYIAKAGADLVIDNIEKIKGEMKKSNQADTTFNIEFSNEGKAIVDVELVSENNILKEIYIKSTGLVKEGKPFESKNKIQAKLMNKGNLNGARIILGVDKDGNIHEFDDNFQLINPEMNSIKKPDNNIEEPKAFAWDGSDTLILVGLSKGNNPSTLIYDFNERNWREIKHKGNDYGFVTWSEENKFYATQPNSGHIYYLDNEEWIRIDKPTSGFTGNFNIEKLAQGKNILIGISTMAHDYVAYKQNNKNWLKKETDINGTYNAIAYGNGMFVIVGSDTNDNEKGHPLIIYSKDGANWNIGDIITDGTGYPLYDIVWTGEKFMAIGGANTIYSSTDGKSWSRFPRQDISHIKGPKHYYDFKNISSNGDYIIAYSQNGNAVLISDDVGKTWYQKIDNNYPELIDIIVINKGDGIFDPKNYNIQWFR